LSRRGNPVGFSILAARYERMVYAIGVSPRGAIMRTR
jgi:hypothetical protein